MCLDTVTKRYKRPQTKTVTGYKMFDMEFGQLLLPYYAQDGYRGVATDTWLKSTEESIRFHWRSTNSDPDAYYPSGFHVFRSKQDAERRADGLRKVMKVRVRGVVALGTECRKDVIVAREMYVPKPRKTQKA